MCVCVCVCARAHGINNHACEAPGWPKSAEQPISAQVMISQFVSSSPTSGSAPQPLRDAPTGCCREGGLSPLTPRGAPTTHPPWPLPGFCLRVSRCRAPQPYGHLARRERLCLYSECTSLSRDGTTGVVGRNGGHWECSGHRRHRQSWPAERDILEGVEKGRWEFLKCQAFKTSTFTRESGYTVKVSYNGILPRSKND